MNEIFLTFIILIMSHAIQVQKPMVGRGKAIYLNERCISNKNVLSIKKIPKFTTFMSF